MTMVKPSLSLTLAILKPDLMNHSSNSKLVRSLIIQSGFLIVRSKVLRLSLQEARAFYGLHSGKEFFERLTRLMSSGPINPMILAHPDAIESWRKLMGPTKRANVLDPESLRGRFTTSETKNAVHGADSKDTVKREIVWFFPDFSFEQWELKEPLFREYAKYNESLGTHVLSKGN